MKFLNETLIQYRNSMNSIERTEFHLVTYVLSSINDRLLIIRDSRHYIKQLARTIILNKRLRFQSQKIYRFSLEFFISWSDDDSIENFLKFNFLRVCWTICLNRLTFYFCMQISILNLSNNRTIAKFEININDLNMLLEATKVFNITF